MNLIEGIQQQCKRLRDELIPMYQECGPAGGFAIAMMRASITTAESAIANGDTIAMLKAYKDLEGFTE